MHILLLDTSEPAKLPRIPTFDPMTNTQIHDIRAALLDAEARACPDHAPRPGRSLRPARPGCHPGCRTSAWMRSINQFGHDEFHFDNNAFAASRAFIEQQRNLIEPALQGARCTCRLGGIRPANPHSAGLLRSQQLCRSVAGMPAERHGAGLPVRSIRWTIPWWRIRRFGPARCISRSVS